MRILYATDLHGDRQNLKALLESSHADLCILAGDLVKGSFRSDRSFFRFEELQRYFRFLKCRHRTEISTKLFVESRVLAPDAAPEERKKAREYLGLYRQAHRYLLDEMSELESLLASFPDKKVLVLPGNYDIDLKETPLRERDLHKTIFTVDGIRIAGYGGAAVRNPGVPDDLVVAFRELQSGGSLYSEPRDFLCEARPDVAVLHVPPFGYFDRLRDYGPVGSVGVRDYLDRFPPRVLLCGHFHENWGVVCKGDTLLVNPSNLGRVPDLLGVKRGGYCFGFILEEGRFRVGTLRQVERGRIYDLADYVWEAGRGTLKQLVIDQPRLMLLMREKPISDVVIRQVREFNHVRNFFRRYETPETTQRVRDLRRVYRDLKAAGEEVAFDLLGSVNFGMSEKGSDVDLVLYRRCPCNHPFPETTCSLPRGLWECFRGLESRFRVEVTDCVNLSRVEASIQAEDPGCPNLQRFVLYRSICRPINVRMIRPIESQLLERPGLKKRVEHLLRDYFKSMVISPSHIYSFKKYEARLHDQGVNLPPTVLRKMESYLGVRQGAR
ncbi:MAG: hypothetical protein AB1640_24965 [bacterium]